MLQSISQMDCRVRSETWLVMAKRFAFSEELKPTRQSLARLSHQIPLAVSMKGGRFQCGPQSIDLCKKPLIAALIRQFVLAADHSLNRDEVLQALYGLSEFDIESERFRECKIHSAVRLISRTRSTLEQNLGATMAHLGITRWLCYSHADKKWHLVRRVQSRSKFWAVP